MLETYGLFGLGAVIVGLVVYQIYSQKKSAGTADAVTTDNLGDKLKAKAMEVITEVAGFGDDLDSTALDLGTLALYRRYMKHATTDDQAAITTAFQSLRAINAKLPSVGK